MNLKTKLAIEEDVSWAQVSDDADKDIQAFNEAYAGDWDRFDYIEDDPIESDSLLDEDYREYPYYDED